MRKQTIGEWILQLLTTPDRAAAIVGDLDQNGVSSMQFWLAIGSNILHAISPRVLIAAAKGCIAQFLFAIPIVSVFAYASFRLPFPRLQWVATAAVSILGGQEHHVGPALQLVAALSILGAQILTALWISRQTERQPLLICMLIVVADCTLGLLRVNNASINMSIWSIPLLVTTVAIRRHRRKSMA